MPTTNSGDVSIEVQEKVKCGFKFQVVPFWIMLDI